MLPLNTANVCFLPYAVAFFKLFYNKYIKTVIVNDNYCSIMGIYYFCNQKTNTLRSILAVLFLLLWILPRSLSCKGHIKKTNKETNFHQYGRHH